MTDTNQLPQSEREAFEAFAQNCPMGKYSIARRGDGYESSHTQLMWDAWQARTQVQGEPFGYIHHFAAHDERGALIDTTWEADGCADPLPHPTFPAMWKWSHCTPFYTTQRPTQATQATDYVGVEPDGIVIGFHEGNALVDHAGNLEEGNCLFLSPTIPTQATQAEVTEGIQPEDFTVDVVVKSMGGFAQINTKGVRVTHKPTGISVTCDAARSQHANRNQAIEKLNAILSLRPEWVPMTDEQISLEAHNADDRDWNDLRFRSSWHEGFLEGARFAEAHHGITAQAKKETT